jgi:hypothetical protein
MIDTFDSDYLKLKEMASESTEPIQIQPWVLKGLIDEIERLGREYTQDTIRFHNEWMKAVAKLKQIEEWIPVSEGMPDTDVPVCLVTQEFIKPLNKTVRHIVRGCHIAANTVDAGDWEDYDDTTYDEEKDVYFVNEAWFELIDYWDDYQYAKIHDEVTHWKPMPKLPDLAQSSLDA